jgi:hypothetical protein
MRRNLLQLILKPNPLTAALDLDFTKMSSLDNRFTFARASLATLTGSSGYLENSPHNIALQSSAMQGNWSVDLGTLLLSGTDVLGQPAFKLAEVTTSGEHRTYLGTTCAQALYTFSVNLKAVERTDAFVSMSNALDGEVATQVNLSTGTLGTLYTSGSWSSAFASIASLGDGWYRVSISGRRTGGTISLPIVRANDIAGRNSSGYAGTTGSGILVSCPQLEQNPRATVYLPTTSTARYDSPRFDYDPVADHNTVLYSQDFSNAAWVKSIASISGSVAGPDSATTTSTKLIEDTSTGQHYMVQTFNSSNGKETYTFCAKAAERTWCFIGDGASNEVAWFDLANGVLGTVQANCAASITPAGNGFYNISLIRNANVAVTQFGIYLTTGNGTFSYTGDGASGIYVARAQRESRAARGNYVQTTSVAVQSMARPHNFILRSGVLDTAGTWNIDSNLTQNSSTRTAPDGSSTAYEYQSVLGTDRSINQQINGLLANTTYCLSVWARKVNSGDTVTIALQGATLPTSGATTQASQVLTTTWVRYSFLITTAAGDTQISVRLRSWTTGANLPYQLWGPQLEQNGAPTTYTPTTSVAVYGPGESTPLGLLIEEQRTNLITSSELANNDSGAGRITVSNNSAVGPDGVTNSATTVTETSTAGVNYGTFSNSVLTAAVHTASVFVKPGTAKRVQICIGLGSNSSAYANFGLTGVGAVLASGGGASAVTIAQAQNGFYRVSFLYTSVASNASVVFCFIDSDTATRAPSYTGTGLTLVVFGGQIELGGFPTSYIRTLAAVSATRARDAVGFPAATMQGFYKQGLPGTFCCDLTQYNPAGSTIVNFTNASTGAFTGAYIGANNVASDMTGAASTISLSVAVLSPIKMAFAYSSGLNALAVNGVASSASPGASPISGVNIATIGADRFSTGGMNGRMRSLKYFPSALSASQLRTLTT